MISRKLYLNLRDMVERRVEEQGGITMPGDRQTVRALQALRREKPDWDGIQEAQRAANRLLK